MGSLLDIFRSDIGKVLARRSEIKAELASARLRREDLQTLPPPAEEVCDVLMSVLKTREAIYRNTLHQRLRTLAPGTGTGHTSVGLQAASLIIQSQQFIGHEFEGMLVYMFSNEIRRGLLKAINELRLRHGPPIAERPAELAGLDARIQELEARERAVQLELDELRGALDDERWQGPRA